jgi:mRNA interferase RelE/StbE
VQNEEVRLPTGPARRIWEKLLGLEEEPTPPGSSTLEGSDGYRVRVGDHRVVYQIDDRARTVEIVRIAHRRKVYRYLGRAFGLARQPRVNLHGTRVAVEVSCARCSCYQFCP